MGGEQAPSVDTVWVSAYIGHLDVYKLFTMRTKGLGGQVDDGQVRVIFGRWSVVGDRVFERRFLENFAHKKIVEIPFDSVFSRNIFSEHPPEHFDSTALNTLRQASSFGLVLIRWIPVSATAPHL
jgi:hypothetical protein